MTGLVPAAAIAMAALLAFGPWEFREGFALGGLNISLPELLAAIALALNSLAILHHRQNPQFRQHIRQLRPLLLALGAWALLHFASALWAPMDHGEPANRAQIVKFSLRVLGMMLLAGQTAILAFFQPFQRTVLRGLLLGLLLLTVLGVLERRLGRDLELFLRLFRDEPTWMLGEQRLSLVFYHANTAAAYFELAAPALILWAANSALKVWQRLLLLIWLATVAVLLSLTYSRAGFGAAVTGALILVIAAHKMALPSRRWLTLLASAYALTVVLAYALNPEMRARVGLTDRSYRAKFQFVQPCLGHPGERISVPIVVRNVGEWPLSNVQAPGSLMYTWMTPLGQRVQKWWDLAKLPTMEPHTEAQVIMHPQLPGKAGDYVLGVDVIRDEVLRISALGNPMAWLHCTVLAPDDDPNAVAGRGISLRRPLDTSQVSVGRRLDLERRHYWRAALLLFSRRPLLGYGADRFRLVDRGWVPDEAWDDRARAHSVPAETAVDFGLLGLTVLLILVTLTAKRLWQLLRTPREQRSLTQDAPALAALAALVGLAVHSQVDYFLAYTQVAVLVWPLLGLACGAHERERQAATHADSSDPERRNA